MTSAERSADSGTESRTDTTERVPVLDLYPGELGLILIMWIPAAYMWYGSYEYSGMAGFFPRFMASIVFVLSSVLLFRAFLPDRFRLAVEGETDSESDPANADGEAAAENDREPERNSVGQKAAVVGGMTGAYMLVGYLVGLLWATPLYVYSYLRYADYSQRFSAGLSIGTFATAFAMMEIFRFPLESGRIQDALGIEMPLSVAALEIITPLLAVLGVV